MTITNTIEVALVTGKGGKDSMGRWHRPYLALLRPNGQRQWIGERGRKISGGHKVFCGTVKSGDVLEFRECGTKGRQGHDTYWVVMTDAGLVAINRALAHDLANASRGPVRTVFAIDDGETAVDLATGEVVANGCRFGGDCVGFVFENGELVPVDVLHDDACDPNERLVFGNPSQQIGDLRLMSLDDDGEEEEESN